MKKKLLLPILFLICISMGADFAISGGSINQSFIQAVDQKDYEAMEQLLKEDADINYSFLEGKYTPLSSAASVGDLKLVQFLVRNGANIRGDSKFPNSPIYLAISGNHLEIISYLLKKGINPNFAWPSENGGTLLINAIQFGHLPVVKLLVDKGADVNYIGNGRYSPLYRSVINDHFEIFEFLILHGAKLNKLDNEALDELNWRNIKANQKYVQQLNKAQ